MGTIAIWKRKRERFIFQREAHALEGVVGHKDYGVTVFEGIRIYRLVDGTRALFRFQDHFNRLRQSSESYRIGPKKWPFTEQQLWDACIEVAARNTGDFYHRPRIYVQGDAKVWDRSYTVGSVVFTRTWDPDVDPYLQVDHDRPLRLQISDLRRGPVQPLTFAKGAGNYPLCWVAKDVAMERGFDDSVVLDSTGSYISEGSGYAILFYEARTNTVWAPDAESSALDSITVQTVSAICRALQINFGRRKIPVEAVFSTHTNGEEQAHDMTEMFVAGTAVEIKGVAYVEDVVTGRPRTFDHAPGPITSKIKNLYREVCTAKTVLDTSWYTRIPDWPFIGQR